MMANIRILIVDDSIVARRMLKNTIERHAEIEAVGTAANGFGGLERIEQLRNWNLATRISHLGAST